MKNELQTVANEDALVPKEVFGVELEQGPKVADLLRTVMQKKEKKIFFNQKEYAEFSDLQVISDYFGLSIRTHDATPVEIHGTKGFKAHADLINKDGIVVGGAEAYCMQDEPNWRSKPLFQLASMAQTRAASKSISNRYRWVVAMAGYGTTPAEEIPDETNNHHPAETAPARYITEKQGKRLYAIWKASGKSDETVRTYLLDEYGITKTREITTDIYEQICEWCKNEVR